MQRSRFEGSAECFRENQYYRVRRLVGPCVGIASRAVQNVSVKIRIPVCVCVNYGRSEMHLIKPLGQQVVKMFLNAGFKGNVNAVAGLTRGKDPKSDLSWVIFGVSRISLCGDLAKCITRS